MDMLEVILWIIYPYTVIFIFMMGLVWHCDITELYKDNTYFYRRGLVFRGVMKGLFSLSIMTGIAVIVFNGLGNDSVQIFQWVVSLVLLRPDMELIENISMLSRMHMMLLLTFLLMFSFTKYLTYLLNPFKLYKRLNIKVNNE